MKGTTRLSWFSKIQDGILFEEDFEASNFIDNDNWLTLQGLAEHSKDQAVYGQYSLLLGNTQDDTNLPVVIKNDLTELSPVSFGTDDQKRTMTVWFYDDATQKTLEGPFLKVELRNSRYLEVGVRNMIDSNFYSVTDDPNVEDSFVTQAFINRTTGWHKFQIANTGTGGPSASFSILIDDTVVKSYSVPLASLQMFFVSLQAAIVGHQTDSFGYFDELKYHRGSKFTVLGTSGRRIEISPTIGTTDSDLSTNSQQFTALVNPEPNDYDINISQMIDSNSITENYQHLSTIKNDVDFQNGDVWLIQEIDFTRKAYPYQDNPTTNGANSESPNGTTETITVGRKEKIQYSIKALVGYNWFRNGQNFFEYSRRGSPFSFALDSFETVFTTFSTLQTAGNNFLFLNQVLGDNFAKVKASNYYSIESADRTKRQVVKVTSLSNSTPGEVFIDQPLNFNVAVGDIFRAINYWPFTETEVPRNNGLVLMEPKTLRYDWLFNLREYVP